MSKNYDDYDLFAQKLLSAFPNVLIENKLASEGLSLTPYIYNECSANCRFCSEKLVRNGKITHICHVCDDYAQKLDIVLDRLIETPLFLSLSWKETSESPDL